MTKWPPVLDIDGTRGHPKEDRDRGWQSVDVNRYLQPQVGAKSVLCLKTERNSAYKWNSPALSLGKRQFLSHVHHRSFLKPRFLKAIYVTKISPKFFFTILHQNMTHILTVLAILYLWNTPLFLDSPNKFFKISWHLSKFKRLHSSGRKKKTKHLNWKARRNWRHNNIQIVANHICFKLINRGEIIKCLHVGM
jgi:hypothetical protein